MPDHENWPVHGQGHQRFASAGDVTPHLRRLRRQARLQTPSHIATHVPSSGTAGHRRFASAGDVTPPPEAAPSTSGKTAIGRWSLPRCWTRGSSGSGGSGAAPEASEASSVAQSLAGVTLASASRTSLVARTDSRCAGCVVLNCDATAFSFTMFCRRRILFESRAAL